MHHRHQPLSFRYTSLRLSAPPRRLSCPATPSNATGRPAHRFDCRPRGGDEGVLVMVGAVPHGAHGRWRPPAAHRRSPRQRKKSSRRGRETVAKEYLAVLEERGGDGTPDRIPSVCLASTAASSPDCPPRGAQESHRVCGATLLLRGSTRPTSPCVVYPWNPSYGQNTWSERQRRHFTMSPPKHRLSQAALGKSVDEPTIPSNISLLAAPVSLKPSFFAAFLFQKKAGRRPARDTPLSRR